MKEPKTREWLMARCRFIVSDEEGPLRRFFTRDEAEYFMRSDSSLTLKVLPRPKNKRLDLSQFEEAPF
jgi:hypothetical protein